MHKRYLVAVIACLFLIGACDNDTPAVSASGVEQATTRVQTNANGRTVEQENVIERLARDNVPGSIKHLYVISAYSGQVLIYSTVRGKVTSSGKRLSPVTSTGSYKTDGCATGVGFLANGVRHCTEELTQDDGTYGSSIPYLFWFDSKGVYHQHYPEGGQIIHISDQPLSVPRIILNMETQSVISTDSMR